MSKTDSTPPLPNPGCLTLDDIGERLWQIEINQRDIKTAICGNPILGHRGVIGDLMDIRREHAENVTRAQKDHDALKAEHDKQGRSLFKFGTILTVAWAAILAFVEVVLNQTSGPKH